MKSVLGIAAAIVLLAAPASAQVDLSGTWNTIRHEDEPDRGPGVGLGDYTGIPLTDGARLFAESWDASRLTMYEQQCRVHTSPYIYRGPLNLRIWEEKDPKTQEVIAIKHYISTYEQTRTIWMDGRPHPPAHAPHTWMGFSTGRWENDRLVVKTTHIKQGWHRRNGVPQSDKTTMTEHYVRHDNQLTHIEIIHDPVYLTEPFVKTQHFVFNPRALPQRNWLWPCQAVVEVATRDETEVPHYLPGANPYLEESRTQVNLHPVGAAGGRATIYPEWRRGVPPPPAPAIRPIATAGVPANEIQILPVQGNVYLLAGPQGNSTIHVGEEGVLVVDTQVPAITTQLLAAIRKVSTKPIRHVVNTNADADNVGGNEALAKAGSTRTGGVVMGQIGDAAATAAVIAHENVLKRMSAPSGETSPFPFGAWPTETFYNDRKELLFNGEGVQILHQPAAHTDGDVIVFFRRSDVIATGDLYDNTAYPVIDLQRGGSIEGYVRAINKIIEVAIPSNTQEGGTMIVPGNGRIGDEMDVVEYRDMVTIVRDRIRDLVSKGRTLEQVKASQPTLDFDARYGSPDAFIEAVYRDLSRVARPAGGR